MNILSVKNLSKSIKGHEVLKNINLNMISGKKYGLVGKTVQEKQCLYAVYQV